MSNTSIRSSPARSNSKAGASSVSRRMNVTQPAVRTMSPKPLCYYLLDCYISSTWLHHAPFPTRHTTARLAIPNQPSIPNALARLAIPNAIAAPRGATSPARPSRKRWGVVSRGDDADRDYEALLATVLVLVRVRVAG
jgi:hypothetical protein